VSFVRTLVAVTVLVAAALGVTLLTATLLPGIPRADLLPLARLLAGVGVAGGAVALLLLRPFVLRSLGVGGQIAGASLFACLLLVGMMLIGAQEMLLAQHDHDVVLAMLLFAAIVSIGLGALWSSAIAQRIRALRDGTARLAAGDLDVRLPEEGRDEIAQLSADFNHMARSLREAADHERELEQARRDLVAAVSHDLRTPLAAVRALIEAVADGVAADAATEERYLRSAQKEVTHLGQLVEDLFELAQLDAGVLQLELERASLHDLISDTLSTFRPQAEQLGVQLVGEVRGDVDPVLINPPKLQRVLHNLLGNALRHTPADGTVALRAQPQGTVVEVEIVDNGEGIEPDDLPHVFERSYRGEKSRTRRGEGSPGAGLGLAIARGLVEAHGGAIGVESEPGRGARFWFTLRRA
jgi:signal transduction histidine kinase